MEWLSLTLRDVYWAGNRVEQMFSYKHFVELDGHQLVQYMEALLNAPTFEVEESEVRRLMETIFSYDEYHCVYAILICERVAPSELIMVLPMLLTDRRDSVFCAALNCCRALSNEQITASFLRRLRAAALRSQHRRAQINELVTELEDRIDVT